MSSSKPFAIVAIRKKVKFYCVNGTTLVQLHDGTIDLCTAGGLDQVERMMDQVKQQVQVLQ